MTSSDTSTIPLCAARRGRGFTLIELLVVIAIIGVLSAVLLPVVSNVKLAAESGRCVSQIRQLAVANLAYSNENRGRFCPATDRSNLVRWHGARPNASASFDPTKGNLSPYLGRSRTINECPTFVRLLGSPTSFNEKGSGGYGYNAQYIGGTPSQSFIGEQRERVPNMARTVMFTDAALAVAAGLQEYPFTEPYNGVTPSGELAYPLQPSTHFRHNGKANVAWADGHVSSERPNSIPGANYYGGNNLEAGIGWFGPTDQNGLWNPRRR